MTEADRSFTEYGYTHLCVVSRGTPTFRTRLWLHLFMFVSAMASALAAPADRGAIGDSDLRLLTTNATVGDNLILGSSTFTLLETSGESISKRQAACYGYYRIVETEVKRTCRYWGDFNAIVPCLDCTESDAACHRAFTYTSTYTWTYSVTFDVGGASAAENAINANIGLSFGYSISKSQSWADAATCDINPHDRASLWAR